MEWFLVALSFSLNGAAPEMAARPVGLGPVAKVACELETALHTEIGTAPRDMLALDDPKLFCLDVARLCSLKPAPRALEQASASHEAIRLYHCGEERGDA